MARFFFFLLLTAVLAFPSFGDNKSDSLVNIIETFKEDTSKVNEIIRVCIFIRENDPDKTIEIATEGIKLSQKLDYKLGLAKCIQNIGVAYNNKSNYEKAVDNYLKALKLFDELKDNDGVAGSYNLLGIVCRLQGNYKQAIEYYKKALQLSKENGNKKNYASNLLNIGNVFYFSNDFESAIEYYQEANEIFVELGRKNEVATCQQNMGSIYFSQGKFDLALEKYTKVLEVRLGENDQSLIAVALNNIGEVYKEKGDFQKATEFINKSLIISKKADSKETMRINYENLLDLYSKQGNYKEAINYFKLVSDLKDTIFNIESNKHLQELSVKYETEKKESENKILRSETERQKIINWSISVGLILLATLAFFIFQGYRQKQKANHLLEKKQIEIVLKNNELENANTIIQEKNKDITDSIRYAKRLQSAILKPENDLKDYFADGFVFFKPKDIVSGDFYWFEKFGNLSFIAAADCTGHGVPGAFMSIIGCNLLSQAVNEYAITQPAAILNSLNKGLSKVLQQKSDKTAVTDGMDIALCSFNSEKMILEYSGAYNSLWIVREGSLMEYAADKFPVGAFVDKEIRLFKNHEIQVKKGDMVYLFTDGFADQFGGPSGKKFKYKPFQKLFIDNYLKSTLDQRLILESTFENWMSNLEQVDDVLVIGIKV